MKIKDYLLLFLTLVIIVMVLHTVHRRPTPKPVVTQVQKYKDSIAKLDSQINMQVAKLNNYEKTIDSLNSLPPKIKIKYRDQKALIPTATVLQLDSIIRTNANLPQR